MKERRDTALLLAIRLINAIQDKRLITLQDERKTQAIECSLSDGKNGEKRAVVITPNGFGMKRNGEYTKIFPFRSRIADFDKVCNKLFPEEE